jgi:hypothetical protein
MSLAVVLSCGLLSRSAGTHTALHKALGTMQVAQIFGMAEADYTARRRWKCCTCHQVSTIGHFSLPTTLLYHLHASGLIGSPTVPRICTACHTSAASFLLHEPSCLDLPTIHILRHIHRMEHVTEKQHMRRPPRVGSAMCNQSLQGTNSSYMFQTPLLEKK